MRLGQSCVELHYGASLERLSLLLLAYTRLRKGLGQKEGNR